jgi:hypothetical protein
MRAILVWTIAVGLSLTAAAGSGRAQFPIIPRPPVGPGIAAPVNRPPVSPYLNLLRRGNPVALNYYNLVRPQIDFQNQLNRVNQQVGVNQQNIAGLQAQTGIAPTGHGTSFLNLGGFFMNSTGGAIGSPGVAGGQVPGAGGARAVPQTGRPAGRR